MNNRLKLFISAYNLSQSEFADRINVVRASVSHVLSGRNKPSYDFITAIMKAYPELNMEWLMLGKGKMLITPEKQASDGPAERSPEPSAPVQNDTRDDNAFPNLFDYEDEVIPADLMPHVPMPDSPQIPQIQQTVHVSPSAPATNSMAALDNNMQSAVKQRNAVKIIIFYDDGTFQEMYTRR